MIQTTEINDFISKYKPDYVVLDCDGTLYPDINSVRVSFNGLLMDYLKNKFNFNELQAAEFVSNNKRKFDTESEIAACFQAGIDEDEFNIKVIEKIPLDSIGIEKSFEWKKITQQQIPIIIFTNNSSFFAHQIATKLGIISSVIKIFGEKELSYKRKPDIKSFEQVVFFVGDNAKILYFDDDDSCLITAKKFGWNTVKPLYKNLVLEKNPSIDGLLLKN